MELHQMTAEKYHVYASVLSMNEDSSGSRINEIHVITTPNEVDLLWLVPKKFVKKTLTNVLFAETGLQFIHLETPIKYEIIFFFDNNRCHW